MHHAVLALGPTWLDPQHILDALGPWALWGAVAIVFAECGLLIGFLLPGDSLLFTVGLLISSGVIGQPIWLACVVLVVAAFAGNVVGYEIGRWTGPAIFSKEDSRIFKKEYVDKTIAFFDKYGARAIFLARFVPIVRTFITVTAGVGQMERRRYLTYSGIGGTVWAGGVTLLGSLLGRVEFVKKNLEVMLLSIVLISVVPIGIEFLRERARARRGEDVAAPPPLPQPEQPDYDRADPRDAERLWGELDASAAVQQPHIPQAHAPQAPLPRAAVPPSPWPVQQAQPDADPDLWQAPQPDWRPPQTPGQARYPGSGRHVS